MKILYVTTISNTVNAFLVPHIKMLIDNGHQVDVAFNIEHPVKPEINQMGCRVYQLPLQRSPFKKENLKAYKMLKSIIISENYDLVHTHTPIASAIVRMACKNLDHVKLIYTAHGFHFFKGAPILNWLIYYPVEKWLARYTDTLITINKEDYDRAKMKFKAKRIEYIPGVGIDLGKFNTEKMDKNLKLSELGLSKDAHILLSVGELNKNKNHEVVIRAIAQINNPQIEYIICGQGKLDENLKNLSKELGIEKQIHLLGFRKDIPEICKISDIFIFPSFREGLSVALMEAMANGLPVICSKIRGNVELIETEKGGYLISPNDIEGFRKGIDALVKNKELRNEFGSFNLKKIEEYSIEDVLRDMEKIYINCRKLGE